MLSGDIGGDDDTDANGVVTDTAHIHGGNAYHVVSADTAGTPITGTTVLDGFTITGGQANGGSFPDYTGGGFLCKSEPGNVQSKSQQPHLLRQYRLYKAGQSTNMRRQQ